MVYKEGAEREIGVYKDVAGNSESYAKEFGMNPKSSGKILD